MSYGKTAFGNLVLVSSGYGAKIAECLAVLFIKNRERKLIGSVDKFFCITLRTDHDKGHVSAPHHTDTAPGSSHGVCFSVFFGCYEQPFFSNHLKWIFLKFFWFDLFKTHSIYLRVISILLYSKVHYTPHRSLCQDTETFPDLVQWKDPGKRSCCCGCFHPRSVRVPRCLALSR